ncbi:MAG: molecular chaperone HtpG [Bacteroidota bacterium]|nr:molecular chaperone HtpG [Bacteroidota bacterium]
MNSGKINVTAENIFPIIKKFLYSDHEIFLRELVSNATDATTKLQTLSRIGEAKGELGDLTIQINVDKDKKTITISDRGVGMTAEEVERYINQVAFSGAEEFLKKYKNADGNGIIGHFGLGFYSAFMVAKKVEIVTKGYNQTYEEKGTHWICEGNPEYSMEEVERKDRGTTIILHIAEDSTEFLEDQRIQTLLDKYCKFLPVPIQFGENEEKIKVSEEGQEDKFETKKVPNIINNPSPAWTKPPTELKDEDYKDFYRELYPYSFDEPLFHIHLNVDYPFDLTGILFFPRIKANMELQRNKIQLYQQQVFVTDNVEGIVPEFLGMLHGVLDSKDIPLNVSRSYLQADAKVKKIAGHITKKVADKLEELFKKDREDFEKKWDDIKVIIEYGILTEAKFAERAEKFFLLKNTEGEGFTWEEYMKKVQPAQTDKDGNTVLLYAAHKEGQHAYISRAHEKGYDVLLMDSPIVSHLMQKWEGDKEKIRFARVDADTLDKLIPKEENTISKLNEEEQKTVQESIENAVDKAKFTVKLENLESDEVPFLITVPEFMRRMKEMSMSGGGMMGMGDLPEVYNLVVNTNHELTGKIAAEKDEDKRRSLIKQAVDLAMLQQNLLHGEALTHFVKRSFSMMD